MSDNLKAKHSDKIRMKRVMWILTFLWMLAVILVAILITSKLEWSHNLSNDYSLEADSGQSFTIIGAESIILEAAACKRFEIFGEEKRVTTENTRAPLTSECETTSHWEVKSKIASGAWTILSLEQDQDVHVFIELSASNGGTIITVWTQQVQRRNTALVIAIAFVFLVFVPAYKGDDN